MHDAHKPAGTIDERIREWFAAHPGAVARARDLVRDGVHPTEPSVVARLCVMASAGILKRVGPGLFSLPDVAVAEVDVTAQHEARLQRIFALDDEGLTYAQIAEVVGLGECRVGQLLRAAGRVRGSSRKPSAKPAEQAPPSRSARRRAVLSLHAQGLTTVEIAEQLGCTAQHVRYVLRKSSVKLQHGGRRERGKQLRSQLVAHVPGEDTPGARRAQLIAEVQAHAQAVGVATPALAWRRLQREGVYALTRPAHDAPAPERDPLLMRLYVREIWRESMVVPARHIGYSVERQRLMRGEGPPIGE